jgi:hypothetical protein
MFELIEKDFFESYQRLQNDDVFNCKYIIVFLGLESTEALFWNVYEVIGKKDIAKEDRKTYFPEGFPATLMEGHIWYDLKPIEGFEDLHKRVVIKWGNGQRIWYQDYKKNEKEMIEICRKGFVKDFPGYLDFTLSFMELKDIYDSPEANKAWKDKLSSVNGIYLILDRETGKQYIGSAYGKSGIWGRWADYAQNIHAGNKALVDLTRDDPNYKFNFQWTVLATLPSNLTNAEVIEYETMYKEKLGSKAFGLNQN